MLTFTEKKLVKDFLKESENIGIEKEHDFICSVLLALGGAVIVLVCLITLNSLSAENIKLILLPGIITGMAILLAGAYGLHFAKRTSERKNLASAIRKLMEQGAE